MLHPKSSLLCRASVPLLRGNARMQPRRQPAPSCITGMCRFVRWRCLSAKCILLTPSRPDSALDGFDLPVRQTASAALAEAGHQRVVFAIRNHVAQSRIVNKRFVLRIGKIGCCSVLPVCSVAACAVLSIQGVERHDLFRPRHFGLRLRTSGKVAPDKQRSHHPQHARNNVMCPHGFGSFPCLSTCRPGVSTPSRTESGTCASRLILPSFVTV